MPHLVPPRDRLYSNLLSPYPSTLRRLPTAFPTILLPRPLLTSALTTPSTSHSVSPSSDATHYTAHHPTSISLPLAATIAAPGYSVSSRSLIYYAGHVPLILLPRPLLTSALTTPSTSHSVSPSSDATHYTAHHPTSISLPLAATIAAPGYSVSSRSLIYYAGPVPLARRTRTNEPHSPPTVCPDGRPRVADPG